MGTIGLPPRFEQREESSIRSEPGSAFTWAGVPFPRWAFDSRLVSNDDDDQGLEPELYDADAVGPALQWAYLCVALHMLAWFGFPLAVYLSTSCAIESQSMPKPPGCVYICLAAYAAILMIPEVRAARYSIVPQVAAAADADGLSSMSMGLPS